MKVFISANLSPPHRWKIPVDTDGAPTARLYPVMLARSRHILTSEARPSGAPAQRGVAGLTAYCLITRGRQHQHVYNKNTFGDRRIAVAVAAASLYQK